MMPMYLWKENYRKEPHIIFQKYNERIICYQKLQTPTLTTWLHPYRDSIQVSLIRRGLFCSSMISVCRDSLIPLQVSNDTHLKYDETQKKWQAHHHTIWGTQRITSYSNRTKWFNVKHWFCSSLFVSQIMACNFHMRANLFQASLLTTVDY